VKFAVATKPGGGILALVEIDFADEVMKKTDIARPALHFKYLEAKYQQISHIDIHCCILNK